METVPDSKVPTGQDMPTDSLKGSRNASGASRRPESVIFLAAIHDEITRTSGSLLFLVSRRK
jgi:hypothetical protein